MRQACIYQIRNTVNGHRYIGQTIEFQKRCERHREGLNGGYHPNKYLQRAWIKFGSSAFEFKVLLWCETFETTRYEQELVDVLVPEYNLLRKCVKSQLGRRHTSEAKEKMAVTFRGKPLNAEHRAKMSAALVRRWASPEGRSKLVAAKIGNRYCVGRHWTPSKETRANISAALRGRPWSAKRRAAWRMKHEQPTAT